MSRPTEFGRFRWISLMLGWVLATWPATALGQEGAPLPLQTAYPGTIPPFPSASQELFERLGKMEECLDWLTKQNEDLLRENKLLAKKAPPSSGMRYAPDSA